MKVNSYKVWQGKLAPLAEDIICQEVFPLMGGESIEFSILESQTLKKKVVDILISIESRNMRMGRYTRILKHSSVGFL